MKLAYQAFDSTGRAVRDTIEAPSVAEATETLRRQGLYATEIAEAGPAEGSRRGPRRAARARGSRRLKTLAVFSRQLHMLVSSGTPIVEALTSLEKQARDRGWREVIGAVRRKVEEGTSLSDALTAYPGYFDPVCLSLVSVGESGGMLPEMLGRIAALTRKRLHVRNSVVGAMIYPALLLVVAAGVLVLMFVFVIPRFAELFRTLRVPLPGSTRGLIAVSGFFQEYWWALLLGAAAAVAAAKTWLSTPAGRRSWHGAVLRLPRVGRIVRSFATARIARLMGVLLNSHVPLLEALSLTGRGVGNVHYAALIERAEDAVTHGEPLSAAFSDERLIDPSVYQAVYNGEHSGRVGEVLANVADFLEEENDVVVRSLTSLIEPVILVLLGGIVALVAMSMFMPMFDLTSMM